MAQYRLTQIEDYEPLVGGETVERIREKARKFKGLRVANFNSTYYGGGVAEMISGLTLLMNSLGLRTEWRVIQGTADFFSITKKMHNALQGATVRSTARNNFASQLNRRHYWLFARPITPQATRAPESPAGCDLRSSAFAWTTTERPMIERSSLESDML